MKETWSKFTYNNDCLVQQALSSLINFYEFSLSPKKVNSFLLPNDSCPALQAFYRFSIPDFDSYAHDYVQSA
jgi:hypothetical protein